MLIEYVSTGCTVIRVVHERDSGRRCVSSFLREGQRRTRTTEHTAKPEDQPSPWPKWHLPTEAWGLILNLGSIKNKKRASWVGPWGQVGRFELMEVDAILFVSLRTFRLSRSHWTVEPA